MEQDQELIQKIAEIKSLLGDVNKTVQIELLDPVGPNLCPKTSPSCSYSHKLVTGLVNATNVVISHLNKMSKIDLNLCLDLTNQISQINLILGLSTGTITTISYFKGFNPDLLGNLEMIPFEKICRQPASKDEIDSIQALYFIIKLVIEKFGEILDRIKTLSKV